MPIPKPNKDETKKDFVMRCMVDDVMVREYKDTDQRLAVCSSTFENVSRKTTKQNAVSKYKRG
jgi:hypothetical protein